MKKKLVGAPFWILALLLVLGIVAISCGGDDEPVPAEIIVGAIHVGPISDAGYNEAHYNGLKVMEENIPGLVLLEAENVPESADAERVMENMIRQGATIIFAQSFGYLDPALNVAADNPDVVFEHPAGYKLADNFGTYWAKSDQLTYALGMAAGKLTKTNKLGFIGGFPIAQLISQVNAFHLGARSVNPDVETRAIYNGAWSDPGKEAAATNTLADLGVDVVTMVVDSPITVVQTAENRGMLSIGYHSADVQQFAPNGWISGIDFTWGSFFTQVVKDVQDGTWESEHVRGDLESGMVGLAPWGPAVPDNVRQASENKIQEFIDGTAEVFEGPIMDTDGVVRIAEGEVGDPDLSNTMDWYVEGVIGRTN